MHCPGKIAMEQGIPDTSSPWADEGSAAHYIGALCLQTGRAPGYYLNKVVICWEKEGERDGQCLSDEPLPEGAVERSRWVVNHEMKNHLVNYCIYVNKLAKGNTLLVEQRVEFGPAVGLAGAFGTSDTIILTSNDREIIIVDLKYGRSEVPAEGNPQLMLYALGALNEFDFIIDAEALQQVRLVIFQPRINNISEWVCPINDLIEFASKAKAAVTLAEEALSMSKVPNQWYSSSEVWSKEYLKPSEKGCKWCKAKDKCPVLAAQCATDMLALEAPSLDGLVDLDEQPAVSELLTSFDTKLDVATAKIAGLPFDDVVRAYKAIGKIELWVESIKTRMLVDMLQGQKSAEFKLIKGRKGNRAWVDAPAAEAALKIAKLKIDEMYDKKLISPSKAEELLAESKPRIWAKVQNFIGRSEPKTSVAPMSAKGESLDPFNEGIRGLPDFSIDDVI
jgi:hypothetical protein